MDLLMSFQLTCLNKTFATSFTFETLFTIVSPNVRFEKGSLWSPILTPIEGASVNPAIMDPPVRRHV